MKEVQNREDAKEIIGEERSASSQSIKDTKAPKGTKTTKEKVKRGCCGCLVVCLAIFVIICVIGIVLGSSESSTSEPSERDTEVSSEAQTETSDQPDTAIAEEADEEITDQAAETATEESAVESAEQADETVAEESAEGGTDQVDEMDAEESVEEATEATSSDDEWPEITALGLDNSTMISIYDDFQSAIKANSGEYDSKFDQKIGDKYGISADDAYLVYSYAQLNYAALVADNGTDISNMQLNFNTLLEVNTNGGTIIIKAKIKGNLTAKMALKGCYFDAYEAIQEYGLEQFDELDYWAVADMTDGSESKVISYTISKDVMQKVAREEILENKLVDYADDVWVLPSLLK